MTRRYARARRGQRQVDYAPAGHWHTTTVVAAISQEATLAPLVLEGPIDGAAFVAYVEQMLVPALARGTIVVMDNLGAHHAPAVGRILAAAGVELRYLPPYSPDLNPIEQMWAKVKASLRKAKARTREELYVAIGEALDAVTPADLHGFFHASCVGMIT